MWAPGVPDTDSPYPPRTLGGRTSDECCDWAILNGLQIFWKRLYIYCNVWQKPQYYSDMYKDTADTSQYVHSYFSFIISQCHMFWIHYSCHFLSHNAELIAVSWWTTSWSQWILFVSMVSWRPSQMVALEHLNSSLLLGVLWDLHYIICL